MGTPTKRYRGTALTCTWTKTFPTSGSAITIDGVKKVHLDPGISQKTEGADGDAWATAVFNDFNEPVISIETINPYALAAVSPAERGTLAYSIADAANGVAATSGGKQVTITNTFIRSLPIEHAFREFGNASITLGAISSDGTTNPVTVTSL